MDQHQSAPPGTTPTPSNGSEKQTGSRKVTAGVLAGLALLAVIGVAAVVFMFNDEEDRQGMVFVIPAGSKANVVPELQSAIPIPTDIRFGAEDVAAITIINEDDVTHRAGPFLVAAGQTYTQRFDKPGEFPIACSVDPAESIVVTVEG